MGNVVRHTACPECGSSDALAVYDDGSTYCWSANHRGKKHTQTGRQADPLSQRDWSDSMQQIEQLPTGHMVARGIDNTVAGQYGVRIGYDGQGQEEWYYFPLYDEQCKLLGYQKKRAKGPGARAKGDVTRVGETKGNQPFGSHLHQAGKMIVVTEGAEDCLAAVQMLKAAGKQWRVVGALGTDGWRHTLAYYERFDKVVICFDQDDGGRIAAEEFASALSHGKPHIMRWESSQGVDPNQLLIEGKGRLFMDSMYNAKPYSPSGIIWGDEVWRRMEAYVQPDAVPYPDEMTMLSQKMLGMRAGEISTWTSGSSIGKTSYIRRLKQWALNTPGTDGKLWPIGEVELEESPEKTWRGMMQFHAGGRWHNLPSHLKEKAYRETYGTNRIFTVDNGLAEKKRKGGLLGKFKHLHYDKGCRLFFLDHITLGVREFGDGGGSLSDQDEMMEELLSFVETTKSHMCLISHLRKSPSGGKAWSQGAAPTEEDMKGCLDASTEYLSPQGWRRMDSYDGGLVGQWEQGRLIFVQPTSYINKPCDRMLRFCNDNSLDMVVSPEHRMLLGGKVRLAEDVARAPGRAEVPVHWGQDGEPVADVRLLVACAADACYHGNGLAKAEFRKARKVERFRQLLAHREYTETVDSQGDTTFRFAALTEHKSLHLCANWYTADTASLATLLDEVFFWDGTVSASGERVFYTSKAEEADVVQYAAHACGFTARVRCYKGRYHVSVAHKDSPKNRVMLRGDSCTVEEVAPSDGRKYCFSVPSTFFVARHNKRIFVTGNSGSLYQVSFDIIGVSRNKVHPDNYERNVSQVHVLKCRETGDTGPADRLYWDHESSRLVPAALPDPATQDGEDSL